MEQAILSNNGWAILLCYGVTMLLAVALFTKREMSAEDYLVANRRVGLWPGALSIAVTWIWAPAIFLCSQKSYEQGLAGIFWFTAPNILCFFTYVPFALRVRKIAPQSYSLPDLMRIRFPEDRSVHLSYLLLAIGTSLTGIISNSLAGGMLLHSLSGTNQNLTICAFAAIALFYSVWRGLPASILTDIFQMLLILLLAALIVPWTVYEAGGVSAISGGIAGTKGSTNPFDPWIAYSFGIPATIGLLTGPICDQMFYQRAMASDRRVVAKTFMLGGLLFGVVPLILSLFGFIAANPQFNTLSAGVDSQLISVAVVQHFLPQWTIYGFVVMALCGLSSTLDSAYCAASSLFTVDIYRRYLRPNSTVKQQLTTSKIGMLALGILGTAIAIAPGIQLIWIFLFYGVLGAAGAPPAILAAFWQKVSAKGVYYGVLGGVILGLPLSIYGNINGSPHLIVISSLGACLISTSITVLVSISWREPFVSTEEYSVKRAQNY